MNKATIVSKMKYLLLSTPFVVLQTFLGINQDFGFSYDGFHLHYIPEVIAIFFLGAFFYEVFNPAKRSSKIFYFIVFAWHLLAYYIVKTRSAMLFPEIYLCFAVILAFGIFYGRENQKND